jgi:DNA repair exonuclease SbcCD ATPase subunit
MRIRRILLNDFRALPGTVDYELRFDGKNLLLFGENGSGKSSIAIALRERCKPRRANRPVR